jgi:uncharacterized protein YegJ (DUF2314 family)
MRSYLTQILIFCLLAACGPIVAVPSGEGSNIEHVSASDPKMNAAIDQAQETLPLFIEALSSPGTTQSGFAIKVRFPYDDDYSAEHMWVTDLTYDGSMFHGTLDNEPLYVSGLEIGDRLDILPDDVSDWLIFDGNRLLGGFTIIAVRARMTPEEQEQFDADFGFVIGDHPLLP